MIDFRVLGGPSADNALLVQVDNARGRGRLLFDCGQNVLNGLASAEILGVDHLCFSHLHLDHVAGFDHFFRVTMDRASHAFGPPETARILQHRLQGYMWNHAPDMPGTWAVTDVGPATLETSRFVAREAFAVRHIETSRPFEGTLLAAAGFTLEAVLLDHHVPSLGYILRETPSQVVDPAALAAFGAPAGPWLGAVKSERRGSVEIDGRPHDLAALRARLLAPAPQASLAYLTDFRLDAATHDTLAPRLAGIDTLVCEAQYAARDEALAIRHHHATATAVARLARDAGVADLVLIHVSRRYDAAERAALLGEARVVFPAARFAPHWSPEEGTGPV